MKPAVFLSFQLFLFVFSFLPAHAQAGEAAWRETRTEHCVFIYQLKDEEAARELVGLAEDVYGKVCRYLDSYPKEVRSIVLGNLDDANGAYDAPPHHLELSVRAPIGTWLGARGESWLRLVFTHELAHYCDLDADEGFFYVLSLILGEGVKSGNVGLRPAWMYEGLAVLLETDFTSGGRGRNPFFLMHAKALLTDEVPFSLGHLEYDTAHPPQNRYYLFGYLLLDYLKTEYGPDVFRDIRRRFLAFPLFGPWGAIRAVTGKHQDVLWNDMRAFWKEKLSAGSPEREGEPATPPVTGDYSIPLVTAGGWYLYRTLLDRPPAVAAFDPQTRTERVLIEEYLSDEQSFSASRDGGKIVYAAPVASGSGLARRRVDSDLFLAEIAGAGEGKPSCRSRTRLTHGRHLWHPALSADGRRLAAVQGAGGYSRLVLVDQATGRVSVLFEEKFAQVYNPAFSPDGKLIAFALNRRGLQDIYLIDADAPVRSEDADAGAHANVNQERIRPLLVHDEAGDYYPRFVDDQTVRFTSDREGYLALYEAAAGKKELVRVCTDRIAAFGGEPAGDGLVYATWRSRGVCLNTVPASGLERVPVSLPDDAAAPPPPDLPEIDSTPFVDLSGFQYWLPYGGFLFSEDRVQLAFGFSLYFASYLDTNGFDVSLVYFPTYHQPDLRFNFFAEIGPLNLYYSFSHTFAELFSGGTAFYREDFSQTLSCELPLADWYAASGGDYLGVSLSLSHDFILDGWAPFAFLNGFSPSTIANGNFTAVGAGLFYSRWKYGGPAAFYPPWTAVNALDIAVPIPVLDETRRGFVVIDRFSCTLPGLWNLSAVRIGLKADYQTEELRGQPLVGPRGAFPGEVQTMPGRAVFILDYLFTIASTDAPLPGGLHFDGLGAGLHWEVPFDWDIVTPAFAFDRYFYVGLEVTVAAGVGKLVVPVGFGVTMRLDWGLSEPVDASDFGFYFFLSFNSFWSGAREKPPLNRRFR